MRVDYELSNYEPMSLEAFDKEFFAKHPIEANDVQSEKVIPLREDIPLTRDMQLTDETPKKSKASFVSNLLFYVMIILIVFAAFVYSTSDNNGKSLFGYSYYTVLTTSMQREIPKGSFVLVEHVPKNEINIGDDITYMKNQNDSVTHRVVEIVENYEDSGGRGFRTKGLENASPDEEVVYEENVVGVVKWHTAGLGEALALIGKNLWFVGLILLLLLVLSVSLRMLFKKSEEEKVEEMKNKISLEY